MGFLEKCWVAAGSGRSDSLRLLDAELPETATDLVCPFLPDIQSDILPESSPISPLKASSELAWQPVTGSISTLRLPAQRWARPRNLNET